MDSHTELANRINDEKDKLDELMEQIDYEKETPVVERKITRITEHIYLSDWSCAMKADELAEMGIFNVICIASKNNRKTDNVIKDYARCTISEKRIHLDDYTNDQIIDHFDSVYNEIHRCVVGQHKILIYSPKGQSRAPTLVIYYCMRRYIELHHKNALLNALLFVKKKRKSIKPNWGFLKQLIDAEQILKSRNSKKNIRIY